MSALTVRAVSPTTWRTFVAWTALFWGGLVGSCAVGFYLSYLDFVSSTKISLYGVSVWLNACFIPLFLPGASKRPRSELAHECMSIWFYCYCMTNLLWEIPWLGACQYGLFEGIRTLEDVVAQTAWMRATPQNMFFWVMASFSSVDLRTVNGNGTFFSLECYAFIAVATSVYFFILTRRRSPYRYLVPVLGCGAPAVATFIFTFSEVADGCPNMPGSTADTLLALVWTQYQYLFFPIIFGFVGTELLFEDWRTLLGSGNNGSEKKKDQ